MFTQFKRLTRKAVLLTMLINLLTFNGALAAPGDLDTTFDGDGLVTSHIVPSNPSRDDVLTAITLQTNGKIVAAGYSNPDFALARYNTNGSLDTTFHADGRLVTNFGGNDSASDVTVQSNGKIVVAGGTCAGADCDVALARYNPSGALDTTFSGDGKQITDFGGNDNSASGIAIQSNGKIVVAGYMWNGTDNDFAVYRYLSNGNLDATFGGDGMVNIDFGSGHGNSRGGGLGGDSAGDLVLQSDGKIVVAGSTCDAASQTNCDFALARLTASGALDTSFSGDGKQVTNIGVNDLMGGLALQSDGKIVVVGQKRFGSQSSLSMNSVIARYNTNGSLDATFNGTGKRLFSIIPAANSGAVDVIVQSNGKIVVLAYTHVGSSRDFAIVRLNPGGAFDTTFSGDGKATVDFGSDDLAMALAVQPSDGKYVLGGATPFNAAQADFALARVLP